MTRRLLTTLILTVLISSATPAAQALTLNSRGIEQTDEKTVSIAINQQTVYITGAQGQTLEVVSLTGRHVMSVKIESPSQRIELNNIPKGCYLLKIGKLVRKMAIR